MVANLVPSGTSSRLGRWVWGLIVVVPIAVVSALSWWFTEPLEEARSKSPHAVAALDRASAKPATTPKPQAETRPEGPPPWPEGRLEGAPANQLLLDMLLVVAKRLDAIDGYTATFHKQERLKGVLGPDQTMAMKVRQRPFAVYLKFLAPHPGKEVVYAEGHRDNKVIAHSTGVSRWLVPRLAVPPDHPLALAETRHAITEVGLSNLTAKLIGFRRLDLTDPEAVTILDTTTDNAGRRWLRSVHVHPRKASARPFTRVEVLYDPETRFPLRISNYDWPDAGHKGELLLAERYAYDDLNLNAPLSALDFDPANPAYAFHRY